METLIKKANTDIDIDVFDAKTVINELPIHCRATELIKEDGLIAHPSGVHFDMIPKDPVSGLASIEYREAESLGYQKVDILSQSAYKLVRDRQHLLELVNKEPDWSLLQVPDVVKQLSQIRKHGMLLIKWKPQSIDELAMFIAMIRPAKRKCQTMNNWDEVRAEVWNYDTIERDSNGNKLRYFKKPHAFAYSLMIVAQLNSIEEHLEST